MRKIKALRVKLEQRWRCYDLFDPSSFILVIRCFLDPQTFSTINIINELIIVNRCFGRLPIWYAANLNTENSLTESL